MNVVVAIDKFKGSCTGRQASEAVINGIHRVDPRIHATYFPVADGGDGFAAVLKHYLHTQTIRINTCDPLGRKQKAGYEWLTNKKIAIIELAVSSGWALLTEKERNPLYTSTRGTGLLIRHAMQKGAKKIYLGLGGSATNDGGMGMAYALGFRCVDRTGTLLEPIGENLIRVYQIIPPKKLPDIQFVFCSDVDNKLYGKSGAAYVFAPQKGARTKEVELLDRGLRNLAACIYRATGKSVARIKGMGAAGGAMALLYAYFPSVIEWGADVVLRESKIDKAIRRADLLITGEGRIDATSLKGKLISRLIPIAHKYRCPLWLVCGQHALTPHMYRSWGRIPVLDLSAAAGSVKRSMKNTKPLLSDHVARHIQQFIY